ncbi:MAG TPA: transposase, partial [Rhodospirillales bacterium]|nr:transposase [Rhodospirillales bacterium]
NPTMRQAHVTGEMMFVDYAGATMEVIDGHTGEVRTVQIFVATLGASSYTYAEATWTQALPNWIGSHTRAFAYFGGVPRQIVPDNLKSGVVKACLYDPEINRTYAGMAAHYDTAIMPARPRKPRDKAKSLPLRRRGWKSASRSSSVGSWPGCAIAASSASPS